MVMILKPLLGAAAASFCLVYFRDLYANRAQLAGRSRAGLTAIGFFTNFLDTLGIGSFAQQTALFKHFRLVDDRLIPGTLNAGNTTNTVIQAFIFMSAVPVEPVTLVTVSAAAPLGAVLGAGVVARLPRKAVQLGMGVGLLFVAGMIFGGIAGFLPAGGAAIGLAGWQLALAAAGGFVFGALQTIGVGFYAPCMAMVYAMGLDPRTAFPIMMTATAMLMVAGSARFVRENAYDRKAALAQTLGGAAGVLIAAYLVRSLPLGVIKWVVLGAVLYTSARMLVSAGSRAEPAAQAQA